MRLVHLAFMLSATVLSAQATLEPSGPVGASIQSHIVNHLRAPSLRGPSQQ